MGARLQVHRVNPAGFRQEYCSPGPSWPPADDARTRAAHARADLETAKLIGSETDKPDEVNFNQGAAGNAVLAAIAASDALCCKLLVERSRGQDHRDAVDLLAQVRFGAGTEALQSTAGARPLARGRHRS